MKYRKKPIVIEAKMWTGANAPELLQWALDHDVHGNNFRVDQDALVVEIHTLEGIMKANVGDWIIKGVRNEFYPCAPDIFGMTYELVE